MKTNMKQIKTKIIIGLTILILVSCYITLHVNALVEAEKQKKIEELRSRNVEIVKIQQSAHNLANMLRDYGSENGEQILQMSTIWQDFEHDKQENLKMIAGLNDMPTYSQEELDLLAKVIYCEAGSDEIEDEHQQLVGQVVLNRVKSSVWPDTIMDVIYSKGQYACVDGKFWDDPVPQRCYDNAKVVLDGKVDCPDNVVYQANIRLGSGVYKTFKTSYSTTYFCYGKIK